MKKRVMISAMQSGSGKTVFTCALLMALKKRGISCSSYKCGPDYIDPMFHSRVLGVKGKNVDVFLQGEAAVKESLAMQSTDFAVVEGAMGLYDGLNGTDYASAWHVASLGGIPVVLCVRPSGSSITLSAQIHGLQTFRKNSRISAVVLTDCKPALYAHLKPVIERENNIPVLGYLPHLEEAEIESRHLGLLTADEMIGFEQRFSSIAARMEETVDIGALLSLSAEAESLMPGKTVPSDSRCTIAVARDEAFCFCYQDTLDALSHHGAELVFFSPLRDAALPPADALYLPGGYPELYARRLSENLSMRSSIKAAVASSLPVVAECGGFMYLQQSLQHRGAQLPMSGVFSGCCFETSALRRFGYLTLETEYPSMLLMPGERLPAHEFHYWDTDANGSDMLASKPNGKSWRCGYASETMYAAFPHISFAGELPLAARFVSAAEKYKNSSAKE